MKEIVMFHFETCPYCRKAERFLEDLFSSHPEFSEISIKKIDERKNPEIADRYDYYYVPTFYYEGRKLHEGDISKAEVEEMIYSVLKS